MKNQNTNMKTQMKNQIVYPQVVYVNQPYGEYKPSLKQILEDKDAIYTIEMHSSYPTIGSGFWFRILRIKNGKRTHDFIIDSFEDKRIYLENTNSQGCYLQFENLEQLQNLFADKKIYKEYKRNTWKSKQEFEYEVNLKTETTIEFLLKECKKIPSFVLNGKVIVIIPDGYI